MPVNANMAITQNFEVMYDKFNVVGVTK